VKVSKNTAIVAEGRGMRRTLQVDDLARDTLAQIIEHLRSTRNGVKRSQNDLAVGLPVRGRAISEWETGAAEPTLEHLMQLARELDNQLVLLGPSGDVRTHPVRRNAGASWQVFERKRLALPLRNRRLALGLSQDGLGYHVGVSRDSIRRWELARVPPRPIALIVWAQKLEYTLAVRPVDISEGTGGSRRRLRQLGRQPELAG